MTSGPPKRPNPFDNRAVEVLYVLVHQGIFMWAVVNSFCEAVAWPLIVWSAVAGLLIGARLYFTLRH